MAQQDTGLGWSAKSDWLMSVPGIMGSINGIISDISGDTPLNTCDYVFADIAAAGLLIYNNADINWRRYAAGATGTTFYGFYVEQDTNNYSFIAVTDTLGNSLYSCMVGVGFTWNDPATSTEAAFPGLYYVRLTNIAKIYAVSNIPIYSTIAEGLAHYSIVNMSFYKLNAGYAVATLASWISLAGDTLTSPVLISSDRNAVILSQDGTTEDPDQMISSYLHDGVRFYMSFLNLRDYTFVNPIVPVANLEQFAAAQPKKVFQILITESYANVLIGSAPDPYEEQDGASEEDGGDGSEIENEPVLNDTHTVPTGGGFYKIFTPTLYQLGQLSQYMWGTLDLDNFKRIFASPIDCILGLGIVPISLTGTNSPVYLGGVDTQLSFPLVSDEVYDFDMGSVHIEKATGSYLDYAPYTKISVYLPFIGFRELDVDDVMDTYLTLKYRIDIATGACIARLSVMGTTLYQFSGSCLKQLPITGTNWDNAITGAISTAVSIGSTVASAGASAPVLAGAVASATTQALTTKSNAQRSGSLSATSGLLGGVVPYIVRTTPKEVIPANQNKYIGYPSYTTQLLGTISGYNEIASIHLEGIPATGDELAEIETLLKGGVIL